MIGVSVLRGKIDQLTIFGQVEFIPYEYKCSTSSNSDVVTVVGDFKVIETGEIERLEIKLTTYQYKEHIKKI